MCVRERERERAKEVTAYEGLDLGCMLERDRAGFIMAPPTAVLEGLAHLSKVLIKAERGRRRRQRLLPHIG